MITGAALTSSCRLWSALWCDDNRSGSGSSNSSSIVSGSTTFFRRARLLLLARPWMRTMQLPRVLLLLLLLFLLLRLNTAVHHSMSSSSITFALLLRIKCESTVAVAHSAASSLLNISPTQMPPPTARSAPAFTVIFKSSNTCMIHIIVQHGPAMRANCPTHSHGCRHSRMRVQFCFMAVMYLSANQWGACKITRVCVFTTSLCACTHRVIFFWSCGPMPCMIKHNWPQPSAAAAAVSTTARRNRREKRLRMRGQSLK